MKGLDLCRKYYFDCVKPILDKHCSFLDDKYSCGLFGWGSEVHRNDDELSRDHEWGPRCVLLLDDATHANHVQEILNEQIPPEFLGFKTRFIYSDAYEARIPSDSGSVNIEIAEYNSYISSYTGVQFPETDLDWLTIAENKLFELTGGEIFYDYQDTFAHKISVFRQYPPEVWKYRIAVLWQMISWDIDIIGLCHARNDTLSAKLALHKIISLIIKLTSTYNRTYAPGYSKWIGTQFYKLNNLADELGPLLEESLSTDNPPVLRSNLKRIIQRIIDFHNGVDELPNIDPYSFGSYNRGFWDIDCRKISDVIRASITGELACIPLFGALDQFIVNDDILLNPELLMKFKNIFSS